MARSAASMLLLSVLSLVVLLPAISARDITLDNNGRYNDVLVSLADDIPEDWTIVDKLKRAFQEASERLAVASRVNGSRSFAFGHVHILVPRAWSNGSVDAPASWQTEDVAHFRVGQRGNRIPSTVQPNDCGRPGLHVNLHRQHLLDENTADLGKQLVHEFAHLRWGVFDEYNGATGPQSFLYNGKLHPVRCAQTIQGKFGHKDTGLPCKVDRATLEMEPDCRFITEASDQQTARGSLMYATYLASVRQFCSSSSGDPDLDHNSAAPNPHNRRCNGRSVQSVMQDHQDYQRDISGRETDTTVNFTVVQAQGSRRLVMVMDVSGSMSGQPLAKLKIAARTLLLGLLEDGINCAMFSFNTDPISLKSMAPLLDRTVRQQYWQAVATLKAGGGTNIGDALAAAMEALGANVNRPSKDDSGYILLLTDGEETGSKRFTFAQASAIAKRTSIIVDTVAFGNKADKLLADLSAGTGGKAYFVRFNSPANDLMEAMSDMVRDRVPTSQKPIDVFSSPVDATFTTKIPLDASISNAAQFTLSSPTVADIKNRDLEVVSPSGVVYSKLNSTAYLRDDDSGIVTISTAGKVESGDWTVRGIGKSGRRRRSSGTEPAANQLSLVVTSRPADSAPIILDGSVSIAKVELRADTRVAVYATLVQAGELLLGANITAHVESDVKVEAVLRLLDDGVGADATKGDGVYSGYVPTTVNTPQEYNVRLVSNSPVSRVSTAGKFEVTRVDQASLLRTPPAPVGDLQAQINLGLSPPSVSLTWTAVGARRMEGTASRYIVWLSSSVEDLRAGFATKLPLSVTPQLAGSPMSAEVPPAALANFTGTVHVAVAAENSAAASGDPSNVVSVQTSLPDNIDEVERTGEGGVGGLSVLAIVFIAIGVVLAVSLVVGLGVFLILKKRPGQKV